MAGNNLDLYNKNNREKKNNLNIVSMFSSLTTAQKISIGLIAVVMIVGIFVVYRWSSKPEYVVLYSNLAAEDTAAIVEQLDGANIKYQVSNDGGTIQVDQKQISGARLLLAEQGLPATSTVGFELFDKQFFGLTDFAQQVNYQRALEGELSKTIASIEEVESVRIHLVLSESEVFSDTATPATASIVLKLKKGSELQSGSVKAITNFVAGSVQGLKKENITIVDTKGGLLTSASSEGTDSADESGTVSAFENDIEKDLAFMLAQVYGADNVLVRVSADINFDKKESQLETYIPKDDGKGVILSESIIRETYDKSAADSSDADLASGADANVPTEPDDSEATPAYVENNGAENNQENTYLKDETTIQYALSKKIETINSQGGNLEKMSIGIFINDNLTEDEKNNIKAVVSAASGMNIERGDTLSIEGVSFAAASDNMLSDSDTVASVPFTEQLLPMLQKYFPGILLLLVLGFLTMRAFKTNFPNTKAKYLKYSPQAIGNDSGAGSIESNFSPSTLTERNDAAGFADSNIPKSGKASQEQIKNRLKEMEKQNSKIAAENNAKKMRQMEDDYIPPEALMGKFSKLRELVGEGVDVNPETARKIIKNWVDVGR